MHYIWNHISYILDNYNGKLPLAHWLKQYYRPHPKLGSRDRKAISDAVYAWFRCGKGMSGDGALNDKVYAALYLCGLSPKGLEKGAPDYYNQQHLLIDERIAKLGNADIKMAMGDIFPHDIRYTEGITKREWTYSLLTQPRLFLRTRGIPEDIEAQLEKRSVTHEWIGAHCLALPNGTKAETVLPADRYWIMDASSQKTGDYYNAHTGEEWWDCCSGAGGKALLLKHLEPGVALTVSDVRDTILQNLGERFKQYGLKVPRRIVNDAADSKATETRLAGRKYDAILCDVPCTGSGTWARTPEGAYFFDGPILEQYVKRQKAILNNAVDYMKDDGRIIYITCSVFRDENEGVVEEIAREKGLTIRISQAINGIGIGADCMYVAVLSGVNA